MLHVLPERLLIFLTACRQVMLGDLAALATASVLQDRCRVLRVVVDQVAALGFQVHRAERPRPHISGLDHPGPDRLALAVRVVAGADQQVR